MANELRQYRGPYAFADPLVAIRTTTNSGATLTVRIKSTYWPVTVDWDDGEDPELVTSDEADAVAHVYTLDGTYDVVVTCGSGHTDTDTISAVINVP